MGRVGTRVRRNPRVLLGCCIRGTLLRALDRLSPLNGTRSVEGRVQSCPLGNPKWLAAVKRGVRPRPLVRWDRVGGLRRDRHCRFGRRAGLRRAVR